MNEHTLGQVARLAPSLPGRGLPWLAGMRAQALAAFTATGFPTLRDEDWKYTSVAPIEKARFDFERLLKTRFPRRGLAPYPPKKA